MLVGTLPGARFVPTVVLQLLAVQRHNGPLLRNSEQHVHDIRAITIDLDDTLWAIHPVIARAEQRLHDWLAEHYPLTIERFTPDAVQTLRSEVAEEFADRAHDLGFLRRAVLRRMGEAVGYGASLVDDAFAIFYEARNDVEIFPGVLPALESLRQNYVLIALTNGNADLDKIGIRDLFDDVISALTAGSAKPSRGIFDAAVRAGGADAQRTLHVGDNPQQDIDGARRAGLKTVWVNRNGYEWPEDLPVPDAEVDHIRQLVQILNELRR